MTEEAKGQTDEDRRKPYEAPEVRTIGTVDDATLGTAETGGDGVGFGGSQ
jgi:hypothetical protein